MALEKITEQQMNEQGVCAAPDILNGTPAQNKALFDRMVRNRPVYEWIEEHMAGGQAEGADIICDTTAQVTKECLRAIGEY